MAKIYKGLDRFIGQTPIIELCHIQKALNLKARIFAKLEYFNPGGSVKDRVARAIIEDAEKKGLLNSSSVIIEPTSGNTGIGLALISAIKGYKAIIVMPDNMSVERIKLIKHYGARVELTKGELGMKGAIERAEELKKEIPNSFIPGQFINLANKQAHFDTTGPEIYADTEGEIDFFVAGVGTGGTITGVGEYLKSQNPQIKIVGVEPLSSAVLSGKFAGAHKIQGIGAGFIPSILNRDIIDEVVTASDEDAISCARLIAQKEGVCVGISSGAALFGGVTIARREENEGKNLVVIFPDTGERYLSTKLFLD